MCFINQMRELMSAKDLYIQNIIVSEHDNHSNSRDSKMRVLAKLPLFYHFCGVPTQ